MKQMKSILIATLLASSLAWTAGTPDHVNYQGVLRDGSGNPLSGSYDMTFRFFSDEVAGEEILVEQHLAFGNEVVVVDGLFSVALGSGLRSDGSGPGVFTQMKHVFAGYQNVWMQIEVDGGSGFEVLAPRVEVQAAPYAMNASELQGMAPDDFILKAGDTVTGRLQPDVSGVDLGSTGFRWDLFGVDLDLSGSLVVDGTIASSAGDSVAINDDLLVMGGQLFMQSVPDYSKLCLYDSFTFCIGMVGAQSYGDLNDYAMTFTMNDVADRGFLWRDSVDQPNDGAMSLTTDGRLTVKADVTAPVFYDIDNTAYRIDPASSTTSAHLAGNVVIGNDSGADFDYLYFDQQFEYLRWNETSTRFEFSDTLYTVGNIQAGISANVAYNAMGGSAPTSGEITNAADLNVLSDVEIGGGLYLSKQMYMEGAAATTADADQSLYFYDQGSRNTNYVRWDDVSSVTCAPAGNLESMFNWNISDNSLSGWSFGNGTDYEFIINSSGNAALDGTLTQSAGCDLAEAFLGDDLPAGTVVALDPEQAEGVVPARHPRDPMVVGVVSTNPGVLMQGPTADAYPRIAEWNGLLEQISMLPPPPAPVASEEGGESIVQLSDDQAAIEAFRSDLQRQADALEAEIDGWTRGNVPVALVGRVPVNVDASYGAIRKGDYLTSSLTAGHGMTLTGPGPYFGIAMEEMAAGQGQVLVLLQQGWYGGSDSVAPVAAPAPSPEPLVVSDVPAAGSETPPVQDVAVQHGTKPLRPASTHVAEFFPAGEPVEPGDVLVVDLENPGSYLKGRTVADPAVVGVVSIKSGLILGGDAGRIAAADPALARELEAAQTAGDQVLVAELQIRLEEAFSRSHVPVALTGTIEVKVDAGFGAVRPGDLLVSSPTPGHAMRSDDPRPGTVIGKALGGLEAGTGKVRILVAPPV